MLNLERLVGLDREWKEIEDSYRLAPYTAPINLPQEKEAVLSAYSAGEPYNPCFEYKDPPEFPIQRIRQFMCSLRPEDSVIERMYYTNAENELLSMKSILTHSPSVITGQTCLNYGLPDKALVKAAKLILTSTPDHSLYDIQDYFSTEDAAAEMQRMLDKLGLIGWNAQPFLPMSAKVSVNRQDKLVKIRKDSQFSKADLRRLLVHEIGVHVIRAENGNKQPLGIFSRGLPGYLDTEEGLAVYSEEKAGVIEIATMRKYAGRVIAAALALGQSFSDVFYSIVPDLGADIAFEIVARAKRGFLDTSQLGAHTKDIVYLKGYENVNQHLKEHPEDYALLFVGKIGLHDIDLVRDLLDKGIFGWPTLLPTTLSEKI
jgi:uncharacterized protein (TIGR02421 family)